MAESILEIILRAKEEAVGAFERTEAALQKTHNANLQVAGSSERAGASMTKTGASAEGAGMSLGKLSLVAGAGFAAFSLVKAGVDVFGEALNKTTEFIKSSVDVTENLAQQTLTLQRQFGMSAESASGLIAVFQRFGVSQEEASKTMTIFESKLEGAAKKGGDLTEGIGHIHIAAMNADGSMRDMTAVLNDVAEAFKNDIPVTERAAVAKQLFGRAGLDMIPTLLQGRDGIAALTEKAKSMGIVIGQDSVEKYRNHAKAAMDLSQTIEGLKVQIGDALTPIITNVINKILEWTRSHGGLHGVLNILKLDILEAADKILTMGKGMAFVSEIFLSATMMFNPMAGTMIQAINTMVKGMDNLQKGIKDPLQKARDEVANDTAMMKQAAVGNFAGIPGSVRQVLEALPSAIKDPMIASKVEAELESGATVAQVIAKYKDLPPDVRKALSTLPQEQAVNIDQAMVEAETKAADTKARYLAQLQGVPPGVRESLINLPPEVRKALDVGQQAYDAGHAAAGRFLTGLAEVSGHGITVGDPSIPGSQHTMSMGFFAGGGRVPGYAGGGKVKYYDDGGFEPRGTDTVKAMLTPGEFIIKKDAVDKVGVDALNTINQGVLPMASAASQQAGFNAQFVFNVGAFVGTENELRDFGDRLWRVFLRNAKAFGQAGSLPSLGVQAQ